MKTLSLLVFLIATLNLSISYAGPGDFYDKANQVYNNKNAGFDKATLGSDCYRGMRAGSRMGRTPMGKALGGFAGGVAAAGKNYIQNTAQNTTLDRCKTMFKGR